MPKPNKHAAPSCLGCTIIAVLGIITGFIMSNALVVLTALLPTAIYGAYRIDGKYKRWLAIAVLALLVLEIVFITTNVKLDLAAGIGLTEKYRLGVEIPLADIKIIGPIIMTVLSMVLFIRTSESYSRWLSAVVLVATVAAMYILDPTIYSRMLRFGI